MNTRARWVLAFDASCGVCRDMSRAVARVCGGKLELMPLAHPDVRQWRKQSLGARAAWAPTLIEVRVGDVRAWTGPAMTIALVRHLGTRSTMRVLKVLVQQHRERGQKKGRLLPLSAGLLAVAGSLMMTSPPSRGKGPKEDPRSWVEANRAHLPQSYDEIITHAMRYRIEILLALPAEVQAQLWVEHLNRYRATHPDLSADQTEVIDRAVTLIPGIFAEEQGRDEEQGPSDELQRLEEATKQAFGDEAGALIATFGPPDSVSTVAQSQCNCSRRSDWCPGTENCENTGCYVTAKGCGNFLAYACTGMCVPL